MTIKDIIFMIENIITLIVFIMNCSILLILIKKQKDIDDTLKIKEKETLDD